MLSPWLCKSADTPAQPAGGITVPVFTQPSPGVTNPPSEASAAGDESEDDPPTFPVATEPELSTGPEGSIGQMNNRASSINPAVDSVTTVIPAAVVRLGKQGRMPAPEEEQQMGGNSIMDSATSESTATQFNWLFFV